MSTGIPTVRSLDARVDDLEREFREFMAEMKLIVTLLKWIGGFSAATLLALIIALFSIIFSAGQLQQKVDDQATAVGKMQEKVDGLGTAVNRLQEKVDVLGTTTSKTQEKVDSLAISVTKIQEKLDSQATAIQEIKTLLTKPPAK